jgi:beta-phosphoglucomutase-like phosphatase (HAD superfamily)
MHKVVAVALTSSAGIASARAAGLRVIGVKTGMTDERLRSLGAEHTIDTYHCPQLHDIVLNK